MFHRKAGNRSSRATKRITAVVLSLGLHAVHAQDPMVPPALEIREVQYSVNGGEPLLAMNEQIVKLQPGDLFAIVQLKFSSQGPPTRNDAASAFGVLRTDPTQPDDFPRMTFLMSDPPEGVRIEEGTEQQLGEVLHDEAGNKTQGWEMEVGTDRMSLALVHLFDPDESQPEGMECLGAVGNKNDGCFEVDERFFLNLQVGAPDFAIDDCSIQPAPSPLSLGEEAQVFITASNQGAGLYYIDAECDIFPMGNGDPVWVGVTSLVLEEGETETLEITNEREGDEFPPRWLPQETGTFLITCLLDPEDAKMEVRENNNFAIIGVEFESSDTPDPPADLSELSRRLESFESQLEISNSSLRLPLCGNQSVPVDGLPRSFAARGIAPSACQPELNPEFAAFRALVAFGRVFAFDAATEILEDVVAKDHQAARRKLQVLRNLFTKCSGALGQELVADSWNTVGDAFPFNSEEESEFIRGTTGNVASILQSFFAYQLASGDNSFQGFAVERLNWLLDERRIADPDSPAFGLIASRPSGNGNNFAIIENNLRALDMLILAHMATGDYAEERAALDTALRRILASGLPPEEVPEAVHRVTGVPERDIPPEVDRETGFIKNAFTAQDLYTIGGIYLLRRGLFERAWEFLRYTDENFMVAHSPGQPEGRPLMPGRFDPPEALEFPQGLLVGLKFFDGKDERGDLIGGEPIDFDAPSVLSIQSEATLDYILFLHEFASSAPESERTLFAAVRRDQLIEEVVEIFSHSQKGGLPVSTRSIPGLFETFDGSLPSAEARIIEHVMKERNRLPLYRGAGSAARKLHFPQFANGQGLISEIVLTNPFTSLPASGEVRFSDDDGLPLVTGVLVAGDGTPPSGASELTDGVEFTIPPLSSIIISTDGQGGIVAGAATVFSDAKIGGVIRIQIPGVGAASVPSSEPLSSFAAPVRIRDNVDTGVALLNLEDHGIAVRIVLRDQSGDVRAATLELSANGHSSQFVTEIFGLSPEDFFEGTIVARTEDGRMAAVVLELGREQFNSLPVTPLE